MRLFHVVLGDEIVGDRRGLVLRKHDGFRYFTVLLIVPLLGRRNELSDYGNCVILNSRRTGWVGIFFEPGCLPRFHCGTDVTGNARDTGRKVRLFEATP